MNPADLQPTVLPQSESLPSRPRISRLSRDPKPPSGLRIAGVAEETRPREAGGDEATAVHESQREGRQAAARGPRHAARPGKHPRPYLSPPTPALSRVVSPGSPRAALEEPPPHTTLRRPVTCSRQSAFWRCRPREPRFGHLARPRPEAPPPLQVSLPAPPRSARQICPALPRSAPPVGRRKPRGGTGKGRQSVYLSARRLRPRLLASPSRNSRVRPLERNKMKPGRVWSVLSDHTGLYGR